MYGFSATVTAKPGLGDRLAAVQDLVADSTPYTDFVPVGGKLTAGSL